MSTYQRLTSPTFQMNYGVKTRNTKKMQNSLIFGAKNHHSAGGMYMLRVVKKMRGSAQCHEEGRAGTSLIRNVTNVLNMKVYMMYMK